mmetsp:Transcript_142/g.356  ORF Transcript_142/g.356 Transcript_142/m.356 type:complete len:151 (-) Transcript_142:224-676(-)
MGCAQNKPTPAPVVAEGKTLLEGGGGGSSDSVKAQPEQAQPDVEVVMPAAVEVEAVATAADEAQAEAEVVKGKEVEVTDQIETIFIPKRESEPEVTIAPRSTKRKSTPWVKKGDFESDRGEQAEESSCLFAQCCRPARRIQDDEEEAFSD